MKNNEILLFAGKWTELENIILSEVSQVQINKGCMLSLICKDRSNANTSIITYTYKYIQNLFPNVTVRGDKGEGKKEKNDRMNANEM
jgi:hypothetical protein